MGRDGTPNGQASFVKNSVDLPPSFGVSALEISALGDVELGGDGTAFFPAGSESGTVSASIPGWERDGRLSVRARGKNLEESWA